MRGTFQNSNCKEMRGTEGVLSKVAILRMYRNDGTFQKKLYKIDWDGRSRKEELAYLSRHKLEIEF